MKSIFQNDLIVFFKKHSFTDNVLIFISFYTHRITLAFKTQLPLNFKVSSGNFWPLTDILIRYFDVYIFCLLDSWHYTFVIEGTEKGSIRVSRMDLYMVISFRVVGNILYDIEILSSVLGLKEIFIFKINTF